METTEFLNRIIEVLKYVNSQTTTGEGKIQLTQEQFDQINQAQDVETMQSYLLAYNVPQYIVQWAADGTQSIDSLGEYDLSLGQAMSEFGSFQAGETIIGVPATYQSPRGEEATDYYTESELVNRFAGKDEEEIAGIQAQLINAGLLPQDAGFIAGDWDEVTQRAFAPVLARVNRRGVTELEKDTGEGWKAALKEYVDNPIPEFPEASIYLPPDFDSVASSIKGMFRSSLNRDPQAYELKLLANTLYSEALQAYQQSEDLKTVAMEQPTVTGPGLLAGEYGNYAAENVQAKIEAEGLTQIDPQAGLQTAFDELVVKEKDRLGENYSGRATRASILSSLNQRPA